MNMDLSISNNVVFGAIVRKQHKKENETSPRSTLNVSNQKRWWFVLRSNVVVLKGLWKFDFEEKRILVSTKKGRRFINELYFEEYITQESYFTKITCSYWHDKFSQKFCSQKCPQKVDFWRWSKMFDREIRKYCTFDQIYS